MTDSHGPAPKERTLILLVDDNPHGLIARKTVLREQGFSVATASCGGEALEILSRDRVGLVVTDYRMPGMNGVELIARIREMDPSLPIIMLSGFVEALGLNESSTGADVVLAKSAGELGFLTKSIDRLLNRATARKAPGTHRPPAKKAERSAG